MNDSVMDLSIVNLAIAYIFVLLLDRKSVV